MYVATVCFTSVYTGPAALIVNIMKNIESSSIVVQWDAVDDNLPTTYTIIWTDEGDLFEVATLIEQTSYTITGLTLDTVYTITVNVANIVCGNGPEFRTSISFSTNTTSTTPSISPTDTASTSPMTTMNPSTTITTTTVTSSNIITTMNISATASMTTIDNGNASTTNKTTSVKTTTTSITSGATITTTIINLSTTTAATTADESSKFLSTFIMIRAKTNIPNIRILIRFGIRS